MDSDSRTRARVIDLLLYKRDHRQRRLDLSRGRLPAPALAPVSPFRPLTPRQIAHRERMAEFMGRHQAEGSRRA